ncbi:MAG: AAA family ATPase [Pseudonocardiales bacterium]|nr:AAA family ATPase [Pseudonocardiales bacterium]
MLATRRHTSPPRRPTSRACTPSRHRAHLHRTAHPRRARCLAQGESLVLDASWTHATHRAAAAELARRAHAELIALQCTAPPEVVAQRLRERTGSISDADEAINRALAAHADP